MLVDSGKLREDAKPLFPVYSSPEPAFSYNVWEGLSWDVVGAVATIVAVAALSWVAKRQLQRLDGAAGGAPADDGSAMMSVSAPADRGT